MGGTYWVGDIGDVLLVVLTKQNHQIQAQKPFGKK